MKKIFPGTGYETPDQFKELVAREPWLSGGEYGLLDYRDVIASARKIFAGLQSEFLYHEDKEGPWGELRPVKKVMSPGFVYMGDCDGFAVECLRRCKDAGIPVGSFRLVICEVPGEVAHMIATLEADQGSIVFDCRENEVVDLDCLLDKGYRFFIASSPSGAWSTVICGDFDEI